MVTRDDYNQALAITPSDTVDHAWEFEALYVGAAGTVVVVQTDVAKTAVSFVAVPAGTVLKMRGRRVNSTSTTAGSMLALRTNYAQSF